MDNKLSVGLKYLIGGNLCGNKILWFAAKKRQFVDLMFAVMHNNCLLLLQVINTRREVADCFSRQDCAQQHTCKHGPLGSSCSDSSSVASAPGQPL